MDDTAQNNMIRSWKARSSRCHLSISHAAVLFLLAALFTSAALAQSPLAPTSSSDVPQNPSSSSSMGYEPDQNSNASQPLQDPSSLDSQDESKPRTIWGSDDTSKSTGMAATSSRALPETGLPAAQILNILEQKPEVIVEVKELLAERLQQQGAQLQADDITDEMLYSRITGSREVRAYVTTFLRARGYVSKEDEDVSQENGSLASQTRDEAEEPQAASSFDPLLRRSAEDQRFGHGADTKDDLSTNLPRRRESSSLQQERTPEPPQKPRDETVHASTDEPVVLRSTAPYNLRSMRDLYTQIPEQSVPLKRFGSEVFLSRDMNAMERGTAARDTPLDVPLGPDYIVGPGDTLTINLWGSVTQSLTRLVDRDGRILLPDAGSIDVAGLSLERAQTIIASALKQQFRDAQVSVTVSQLRSVRVYVVGDVQRPGGYDVSALATPLSALYAAGGPTSAGSLRIARHLRGNKLVEEIDLYDFLLHGLRKESVRFESGDTLLVPPAGPQVALSGAVKRPAIYELKAGESTLAAIIADAGGFTVAASLGHITIERIDANHQRQTVTLNLSGEHDEAAISAYPVQDGDRIRIAPILPYSERAIYLEGHVVRPGREPYSDGMHLSDVLHSYRDMLPEPAAHGEIVRLVPPDLHAETIAFNVPDVLIGNANLNLQPFDTIRIFGRYEVDAPRVTIHGEVLRPGSFPLSNGMTAAQLVRMAGGFKTDALLDTADLTSYTVTAGSKVIGNLTTVRIGAAVSGADPSTDIRLKPGDILTIHQITGWNDIGESVKISGQVAFPGSYGFQEGERLSSVLKRAGGFRDTAYPAGAVLVRLQVRDLEEKSRQELIRQIETSSAAARLSPNLSSGDSASTLQLIQVQQDQALAQLKSQPPIGRLVVHITEDIDSWANTPADIELRRGDVLTIPKRPSFVLVTGQVYNATALSFTPGKTAGWYLSNAGGATATANRKEIFVIRANGSVIGRRSGGWFDGDVLSTKLDPGDVVVVPQKVIGTSLFWKNLLSTAQIASSIAVTAAVAGLL